MSKALLVLDAQADFFDKETCVYSPENEQIFDKINTLLSQFELIIFTQIRYPHNHVIFEHSTNRFCEQGTPGVNLDSRIDLAKIKGNFYFFKRGLDSNYDVFSAFYDFNAMDTGLNDFLFNNSVEDLYIAGIDHNFSLTNTVLDAISLGYNVIVISNALSPKWDFNNTLLTFYENKIDIIESWELPLYKSVKTLIN